MTNNQKSLAAGKLSELAHRKGTSAIEKNALLGAAYELRGQRTEAIKHMPSEKEMTDEGFKPMEGDNLDVVAGNAHGTANSNAGRAAVPNENEMDTKNGHNQP